MTAIAAFDRQRLTALVEGLGAVLARHTARANALSSAVRAEGPAAIEVGLAAAARIEPEASEELALQALAVPPWPLLAEAALATLSKRPTERAFLAQLDHLQEPRASFFLESSAFHEGCATVVDRLRKCRLLDEPAMEHSSVADLAWLSDAQRSATHRPIRRCTAQARRS